MRNTSSTGFERIDFIDGTGAQISAIQVSNSSPSIMHIFNNRPGASVRLNTAGLTRLTVAANGNIGIGTTSPTQKLHVIGNALANAHTVPSSRRWKQNIVSIEGALDKVQRLRGVSFDWTATGKHDIGLIAEEVGEVIPEVVTYEGDGQDAQSVDYARLVAVLIEAMKEQHEELEELRALVRSFAAGAQVAGRR